METKSQEFTAIQCKFYAQNKVHLKDLAIFLSKCKVVWAISSLHNFERLWMDVVRLLTLAFLCMFLLADPIQQDLQNRLNIIQKQLQNNDNIWLKRLSQHKSKTHQKDKRKIIILNHTSQTSKQQEKISESEKSDLFGDLVRKPPTPDPLSNICFMPYISKACSFLNIKTMLTIMQANQKSLWQALDLLREKLEVLKKLQSLDHKYSEEIYQEQVKQEKLQNAQNLLKKKYRDL